MYIRFKVAALLLMLFLLLVIGCKDKSSTAEKPALMNSAAEKQDAPLVINAAMEYATQDKYAGGDGTTVLTDVIARPSTSIFILDDTSGQITVHNTSDFGQKQTIQLPLELYNKAKETDSRYRGLNITDSGHILLYFSNATSTGFSMVSSTDPDDLKEEAPAIFTEDILYWDGSRWITSTITKTLPLVSYRDSYIAIQAYDQISNPTLDSEDAVIYWVSNRIIGFGRPLKDHEHTITIRGELYKARIQEGELAEEMIGTILYDECECGTGCDETCPTSILVSPSRGIKDSIVIEHFIWGQTESSIAGKTHLVKVGDRWIKSEINRIYDKPVIIYDKYYGCCGWENESGGEIELLVNGNKTKLFDEWEKFDNRSFNISFSPDSIELSSDMQKIAYTLDPGDWNIRDFKQGIVRESYVGGATPEKTEAIKASLANSPMIEVRSTTEPVTQLLELHNAEFIGWLDNNTILIFKDGHLGKLNVDTKEYTESPITATSSGNIYLR